MNAVPFFNRHRHHLQKRNVINRHKDLHEKVSIEDWEELYENHQENLRMHDMEVEVFGEALKDEDLLADLDALEAEEAAQ